MKAQLKNKQVGKLSQKICMQESLAEKYAGRKAQLKNTQVGKLKLKKTQVGKLS